MRAWLDTLHGLACRLLFGWRGGAESWAYPEGVRLEASTACQLRCPACPTTQGKVAQHLGTGLLHPHQFELFLATNPEVKSVELSNYGEVFLNPGLPDILRIARDRQVKLTISNGANFNNVSPQALEALVQYQVQAITCSIDGASQATYSQYRVRGNFDKVIENLRALNQVKQRLRSKLPYLNWQFIRFAHNQHEIPAAEALARELGMKFFVKRDWRTPKTSTEPFDVGPCLQLWRQPQLNWDGKLLGCCVNFWRPFSSAGWGSLRRLLNSAKLRYARAMLMGRVPAARDIACTTCSRYRVMASTGQWVRP